MKQISDTKQLLWHKAGLWVGLVTIFGCRRVCGLFKLARWHALNLPVGRLDLVNTDVLKAIWIS